MGLLSRFESKAEDFVEGGGGLEPVKIAKRAAKEMQREKMVGVGHEYAPTLYNVLVSPEDDARMQGYYPTLAGEIETYLTSAAAKQKLVLDCPPLVRFIVDGGLKQGRFDVIAENVSPAIIDDLRQEELIFYGLADEPNAPVEKIDNEQFDPFTPADMQSAAYVPLDAPAQRKIGADLPPMYDEAVFSTPFDELADMGPNANAQTVVGRPVPAPQKVATLFNRATGRDHVLSGHVQIIGRSTDSDIVVRDSGASRTHAEVMKAGEVWVLRDAGSTNGTLVNGAPVTSCQLVDGDVISIGNTDFVFQGE